MKKSKVTKAIEQLAAQNRISTTEMRNEMELALSAGYENRDNNEYARTFWSQWNGRKPSLEEFIFVTSKRIRKG